MSTAATPVRYVMTLIVVLVLMAGLIVFTSGHVQAATNKSVTFTVSWTFKSKPLDVCIVFTEQGTIHYTLGVLNSGNFSWLNQKLTDPTLSADVHWYNGGRCIGPSTVTKISMGQFWTGYSCNFNPLLSVWGVTFGNWPSCGSRDWAEYMTSYGSGAHFIQYNSGSPTAFGDYTAYYLYPPCYGVYVSATANERNVTGSFSSSAKAVCLPS
jgi:hypothetical protein